MFSESRFKSQVTLTEGKDGDSTRIVDIVIDSPAVTGQSPTIASSQAGGN